MRVSVVLCLLATACVSFPAGPGQVSGAGYVGDRAYMSLSEVVVTVPNASNPGYRNLHVGLAAIINPKTVTSFDPYDVERIVRRTEPRIAARVVESILGSGSVSPAELTTLKNHLTAGAQAQFDSAFSKWKHAEAFQVELVVTSLYLTDGSVGRDTGGSRLLW